MVIRMGEIVKACPPPPCLGAVCACAGGGFAGTAKPLVAPTCKSFIQPCTNGEDLCSQCFRESGCAGGSKKSGGRSMATRTCERKSRNGTIKCRLGDPKMSSFSINLG